jgi:ATP-dependent Clp protease, protease subunit
MVALADVAALLNPHIRLFGSVDEAMLGNFFQQLGEALEQEGPIIMELTTPGGDADIGRRIALQIRLCRNHLKREMFFVGTTTVYSAGVVIMAAFANTHRYLARDTALLIHGRRIEKDEIPGGPLTAVLQVTRAKIAELEKGIELERAGFSELIIGSDIGEDEIRRCAEIAWYLTAQEALDRRLVAGLL